jgi:hypothetical protein
LPHYKCGACKIRLQVPGALGQLVGDLCPECGAPLERVVKIAELVGLRSLPSAESAADPASSAPQERIDRTDEFLTRRAAILAHDRLVANYLLDHGDELIAAEVALPRPTACQRPSPLS